MGEKMNELMPHSTFKFIEKAGYKGMDYPRWRSIVYVAKYNLGIWRCTNATSRESTKRLAIRTIAYQPFSGIRPEYTEKHFIIY